MGYQKTLDLKGTQKLGEKTSQMMKISLEMWNKGALTTQNNDSKSQQPPKHLLHKKQVCMLNISQQDFFNIG